MESIHPCSNSRLNLSAYILFRIILEFSGAIFSVVDDIPIDSETCDDSLRLLIGL